MVEGQTALIHAPATAANLGPGFDCLGLSLDLWNEVRCTFGGDDLRIEIEGEGAGSLPTDETNLVYQSIVKFAEVHNLTIPTGVEIHCLNRIPVSSGLGSSSAAITAGLMVARELLGVKCPHNRLLEIGFKLEGHLDNLATCLHGGLTITVMQEQHAHVRKIAVRSLPAVIALPQVELSTQAARRALPPTIPLEDAVFTLSRTALLVSALSQGNLDDLALAMDDRLHQPYRFALIPGAQDACAAALQAGALGAAICGAGPSVIAFLESEDDGKISGAMQQAFQSHGLQSRAFKTLSTNQGAY